MNNPKTDTTPPSQVSHSKSITITFTDDEQIGAMISVFGYELISSFLKSYGVEARDIYDQLSILRGRWNTPGQFKELCDLRGCDEECFRKKVNNQ